MANLPLSRLPVAVAEEIFAKYGPSLSADRREELANHIMNGHSPTPGPLQQRLPDAIDPLYAAAGRMRDYSQNLHSPTQWMEYMATSMDAIKDVLTYLTAQDSMALFASNKPAERLYREIIQAGLAHVFHRYNIKQGEML